MRRQGAILIPFQGATLMLKNTLARAIAVAVLGILANSCSQNSPQAIADKTKNLGAYAETSNGIVELPVYGVEDHNIMTETMDFKFSGPIPTLTGVTSFVVNIPDTRISEAKLYLLPDPRKAQWHYFNPQNPSDPRPIAANIQPVAGVIYRVIPADTQTPASGFLCLRLKMPEGTADRLYAVHVEK
jgi:hypothetical protein